jgi:thiamine biosynthesis lipoprotein
MSRQAMGGVFIVTAYGDDRKYLEQAVTAALSEASRLEHLLSNYREDSEWSRMNRLAGSQPVHLSQEVFDLLQSCGEYTRESEGSFDITVGPLMRTWGFFKDTGFVPDPAELKAAGEHVGWRYVVLDRARSTVQFSKPGVELDPGGIGKGYAVDRMAEILRQRGVRAALISAASSSIYALGAPPGQARWEVGIRNPANPHESIQTVHLKDESISTSGAYVKYFVENGRAYSHIMDPLTGFPVRGRTSVSVIAARTIDSEAWAKPYFVMGREWAARHRGNMRVFMCEAADALQTHSNCAWVI